MSQTNKTPDVTAVEKLIGEMSEQMLRQDTTDVVKEMVKRLDSAAPPQYIMDLISVYLFRDDALLPSRDENGRLSLTSQDALSLLGVLVTFNRGKYLKPAALAVRNEAVRLATSLNHVDLPMHVSPPFMNVMIQQLESSDVQASANAEEAIVACCRKLGLSFAQPVLQNITSNWRQSTEATALNDPKDRNYITTVWVRRASAVVAIASAEDAFMEPAISCGAMDLILALVFDNSDPLLQMSMLDLIEKLATTLPMHHQRAVWLFSERVVQPLLAMAGGGWSSEDQKMEDEQQEPDPIMGGPALRVVACLCALGHRDSSLYGVDTKLLQGFHRALHNFAPSVEVDRLAIIDAISNFASASPDALQLVLDDPVTRHAWLSLNVAQPKLKSAILYSVAMVLDPTITSSPHPGQNQSLNTSTERNSEMPDVIARLPSNATAMKLFSELGRTNGEDVATNLILNLAKSPLPETRLGAYALLQAVAKLSTGGQVLLSHPDFYDWLVSRDGESTKEGREAKFLVVKAVYDCDARHLLADDIVRRLEQYVKQGPHYHKALSWEVATY